ncbi:MAG: diaminopimelate epimerase [bacterium]|nr:diaminopimelate epimerase [bacterium]
MKKNPLTKNKRTVSFIKISATGNDFILFDNRNGCFSGNEHDFFRHICQRRLSVGADGILLIENSERHDFSLRYFNSDGNIGEMCGNGARAASFYAHQRGIASAKLSFDVLGVAYRATVKADWVELLMPPPVEIREYPGVLEEDDYEEGGYLNVGVPHYVVFVPDVDAVDVESIGRKYRFHQAFKPWGTNTNFVQIINSNTIKIRTYERGVEEETLACGTGTISSAIMAAKQKGLSLPLEVNARGGALRVNFDAEITEISLEGQVKIIYEGKLILNDSLRLVKNIYSAVD